MRGVYVKLVGYLNVFIPNYLHWVGTELREQVEGKEEERQQLMRMCDELMAQLEAAGM